MYKIYLIITFFLASTYNSFGQNGIIEISKNNKLDSIIIIKREINSKIQNLHSSVKKYLTHKEPLVRGAAVWSINKLYKFKKTELFQKLKTMEKNKYVKFELNRLD